MVAAPGGAPRARADVIAPEGGAPRARADVIAPEGLPPARVRVEPVMGTVASLHVRDDAAPAQTADAALDAAIAHLHEVDRRFSTYREDSEIRRLDRGELAEADCHPDVRAVLRACEELRQATDGIFDVRSHRPDGHLDPSGYVKGWAVDGAAAILDAAGIACFCLNVGGDIVARGEPAPGRGWRIGIRHPDEADRVAAVLVVRDLAVATSGLYERGDHIRHGRTGEVERELRSVTVVGPTLALADAYATTAFAMGRAGIAWVARQPGFGAYAITSDGMATWTPEVDALLA